MKYEIKSNTVEFYDYVDSVKLSFVKLSYNILTVSHKVEFNLLECDWTISNEIAEEIESMMKQVANKILRFNCMI